MHHHREGPYRSVVLKEGCKPSRWALCAVWSKRWLLLPFVRLLLGLGMVPFFLLVVFGYPIITPIGALLSWSFTGKTGLRQDDPGGVCYYVGPDDYFTFIKWVLSRLEK